MNSTKFNFRIKDANGLLRFTGTDDSWFTLEQALELALSTDFIIEYDDNGVELWEVL